MPSAPIPTNDSERLETLYAYSVLDTFPEQEYEDVTQLATFICGTPTSLISLVDRNRQWFKSVIGFGADHTHRGESFCAYTLTAPTTLVVEDTHLDSRFSDNPLVIGDPRIRFYAGAPLVAPNGHVLGTVCVIDTKPRTITDQQKRSLEALARQVMALLESRLRLINNEKAARALIQAEKLAAVGRLASSIAHEINNPLEAVTNLLYLSRLKASDSEQVQWLDQAAQEMDRVTNITTQTLRFHRQAGLPQLLTCSNLFSTTLSLYKARLRNAGITTEERHRANEPVKCFERDIRQVLNNVIANAVDAMPNGGRLLIRSREARDWKTGRRGVVLTIADTGVGFDPIARTRMFEAFYSTKGIGGSGLGLWISADIMQRHSGKISVRSSQRIGHLGTVVAIFIPYKAKTLSAIAP